MDQNRRNRLEAAQAIDGSARRGRLTSKQARRARGMAHGLTMLTMRRDGEFRLGVKTEKGVLDVAEAATLLHMHAPASVDDLLQNEDGPSLNALVDAARQADLAEKAVVDERSIAHGP